MIKNINLEKAVEATDGFYYFHLTFLIACLINLADSSPFFVCISFDIITPPHSSPPFLFFPSFALL